MNKSTIAAQLFTLRNFTQTAEDLAQTLKKVKDMGYQAVQVSAIGKIDPATVKAMADDNGLKICITHTAYNRIVGDTENVIKEHKLWDCEYIGLGSMPTEFRSGKDGYISFAKEMSKYARILKDNGLKFAYHNHKFEFQKFDGVTGLEILFNESDPDVFGFELDTCWVQAGGADPVDWIYKVKGRMGVVHFKDLAIIDNEQMTAEIGEGNLSWGPIIKACRETGVEWYAIEQDRCLRDPFESLAISLKYLHQHV